MARVLSTIDVRTDTLHVYRHADGSPNPTDLDGWHRKHGVAAASIAAADKIARELPVPVPAHTF